MSKIDLTNVQTGYRVTAVINDNNQKIETAMENTLSRDGRTPNAMEAVLDMGSHKVINVAPGSAASDAVTKAQLDTLGQSLPQTVIDQIATRVVEIINEGGGIITPPGGYTNPPAPSSIATSAVTATSVTLTWTISDATWVEGYNLWRNGTLLQPVRGAANLTYTDTTVSPSTQYTYTVSAYNDTYDYETARASATSVTTPASTSNTTPGAVTGLTAVQLTSSSPSVNLNWLYNSLVPIGGFEIRRNGSTLFSGPFTVNSYVDSTALYGATYTYTVVAYSPTGGVFGTVSNNAPITISDAPVVAVPAPTNVTYTVLSSTSIRINWVYSANTHSGFYITVDGPNGTGYAVSGISPTARSYTATNLTPSTAYQFVVSAIDPYDPITPVSAAAVVATTQAGVVAVPIDFAAGTNYSISARVGQSASSVMSPLAGTGGLAGATYAFASTTALPNSIALNALGQWSGNFTEAVTNKTTSIGVTDGVNTKISNFTFNILPTQLVVTPPSGLDDGETIAIDSSGNSSRTWTVTGGTTPYTINITGPTIAGMTYGTTSTTATFSGTGTLQANYVGEILVSVSSSDGQTIEYTYPLTYTYVAGGVNLPPVFTSGTAGSTYTVGTAVTAMNTVVATDPEAASVTYALESVTDKSGNSLAITGTSTQTVTGLGITFVKATGVLGGTYTSGADANSPYTFTISADDGVTTVPLTVSSNIPRTIYVGAAVPTSVGIQATGGSGSYTYSISDGTPPTWLGNAVNSSGILTGATGSVAAGVTTFTLRATDTADSSFAEVEVTINALAALTNDFTTRATGSGYYYSTNFQDVYLNGVKQNDRTITGVGDTTNSLGPDPNRGTKGIILGEFYSSLSNSVKNRRDQVEWITDPTGYQPKVVVTKLDGTEPQGATLGRSLDGIMLSPGNGQNGTVYYTMYTMFSFFGSREIFAYADAHDTSEIYMKLYTLGGGYEKGEVVIGAYQNTGFLSIHNFSDSSNGTLYPALKNLVNPHFLPNSPWMPTGGSSTSLGRPYQFSGIWGADQPAAAPVYPTDNRTAFYNYYGAVLGSSKGMTQDFQLGATGVNAAGVQTSWLDERTHIVDSVDQGWPAACVKVGTPSIEIDKWNYVQLFYEREADGYGRLMAWHMTPGGQWRLFGNTGKRGVNWGNSSDALSSHMWHMIENYDTTRVGTNPNRPVMKTMFGELHSSPIPIKGPGGAIPTPLPGANN